MASTITTSIVAAGSNNHATTSYEANAFATDFVGQGVVGSIANTLGVAPNTGSFAVNAQGSPAMFVDISLGSAWITATPSGQASQSLRAYMTATYTSYAISANASGSTKYDWIYLKVDPTKAANPASDASDVTALFTSRSSSNTSDNGSPPTYGIPLAVVTVVNGASSIGNSSIQDKRSQVIPSAQVSGTGTGWTTSTVAPNSVTANGNRSYSLVFNSTDLTGSVSPGMRVQVTRTVAAPTQCTSLNGTTQYYSKTSPAGMTFTDNFTCSAWVKLSSYPSGNAGVISRFSTSGWILRVAATGQVEVYADNGVTSRAFKSYQSLPLNKWVHIAASMTMSTGTGVIYMDGVVVPNVSSGSTGTVLVQAGNLEIGSYGAANFFPGKIAQASVYLAVLSGATILASMHQTLTGTETSLISAYSFNNSINDLNANANNLTANGSAVATNLDTPFTQTMIGITTGTLDYGIVTSISFSSNTTMVVQVPEGCTIPTSGGVSAIAYSTSKIPYGFPSQRGKWILDLFNSPNDFIQNNPTATTFYNPAGLNFSIPIGEFKLRGQYVFEIRDDVGSPSGQVDFGISTSASAYTDRKLTSAMYSSNSGTSVFSSNPAAMESNISNSTATTYYMIMRATAGTFTVIQFRGTMAPTTVTAELAYL